MFPGSSTALATSQVGLASARPSAGSVPKGYLYYATDTNALSESDGNATWTQLVAGGGGGNVPISFTKRTAGSYTLNSATWTNLDTGLDQTIAAATGDVLEVSLSVFWGSEAVNTWVQVATIVSAAPVNFIGSGEPTTTTGDGIVSWAGISGVNMVGGSPAQYTVQAGDISGGNVVCRLRYRQDSAVNKTLFASSLLPLFFSVKNLKH